MMRYDGTISADHVFTKTCFKAVSYGGGTKGKTICSICCIREKEFIYEMKRVLPEEKKNDLDMKLKILKPGMEIQAEYFEENVKRPGYGQYHTVKGKVDFYDPSVYLRIGNVEINIHSLFDLSGDNFEILELPC